MKLGIHETVLLIQREKHYKAQFLNLPKKSWIYKKLEFLKQIILGLKLKGKAS